MDNRMKTLKIAILGLAVIAAGFSFTGCTTDEGTEPTLAPTLNFLGGAGYTAEDATVSGGTEITVGIDAKKDAEGKKLEKFEIRVSYDGSDTKLTPDNCGLCDSSFSADDFEAEFTTKVRSQPGTETWHFTVIDRDGNSTTKSITITTTAEPKEVQFVDVTIGNQNSAQLGSSVKTSDLSVLLLADAKAASADIDFIYVNDDVAGSIICAPASAVAADKLNSPTSGVATWATRNDTKFKKTGISSSAFDGMTNSALMLQELSDMGGATDQVSSLAVGDVILISSVSANGRNVLVKISSIDQDNSMTLKVAAEKE
jgi:hypothetical protein